MKSTSRGLEYHQLAGHRVGGVSIGGFETFIDLPGSKLCFDLGRCPEVAVGRATVLVTHAHIDHLGGVAHHCATRCLRHLAPPTYVVAPSVEEPLRDLFDVWRRLDGAPYEHSLVVVGPGQEYEWKPGWFLRPFASPHRGPCQGYSLWSSKRKLLPEYSGRPEKELVSLRREGITITRRMDSCEVAYPGDSMIEVVEREEALRQARLLILEATFLDGRVSVEESRSKGHIHLDEIVERAHLFENEHILLVHFSARYRSQEILRILDDKLPTSLRGRVTPLLTGFGR